MTTYGRQGEHILGFDRDKKHLKLDVGQTVALDFNSYAPSGREPRPVIQDPTIVRAEMFEGPWVFKEKMRRVAFTGLRYGTTTIVNRNTVNPDQAWGDLTVEVCHRMSFYPGEWTSGAISCGTIHAGGKRYSVANRQAGDRASTTVPPGEYTLGTHHYHTAANWPLQVVPNNAKLELSKTGDVQYMSGYQRYTALTGPQGAVTLAFANALTRAGARPDMTWLTREVKAIFVHPTTNKLREEHWTRKDCGQLSWNLLKNGHPTRYFIFVAPGHSPADEVRSRVQRLHADVGLYLDRVAITRLGAAGYLQQGVTLIVRASHETSR